LKWEMMSGQLSRDGKQTKYHVRCKYCRTVRILTGPEIANDDCDCPYNKEEHI